MLRISGVIISGGAQPRHVRLTPPPKPSTREVFISCEGGSQPGPTLDPTAEVFETDLERTWAEARHLYRRADR